MLSAHATLNAAALGDELTESEATVRVFLTAGGLAILGFALLLFTIWWWRGTKPEPPALGPLEVMSDRRWQTASDPERLRMVDRHRPAGASGLEGRVAPVPIDLSTLARDLPSGFDDLRDDPARWPATQPPLIESSLAELLEGVGDAAIDDLAPASDGDADPAINPAEQAVAPGDDIEPDPDPDLEPDCEPAAADLDETMYQVEAPAIATVLSTGAGLDDDHENDDDHAERAHADDQPDELLIDPLLQRTASQD